MNPLVSVIIPSYCHGQYIERCIFSVLNQTYKNLEIIVVDNYSDDSTYDVISKFVKNFSINILFFQYQNDGIIAKSRNFGVAQARGEILAFLDADDEWCPEKIEQQIKHLNQSNVFAVASSLLIIGDSQYSYNHLKHQQGKYRDYSFRDLLIQNPIVTSSVIIKREIFIKFGGFNEHKKYAFIEDWELWLRLIWQEGVIRVLSEPLVKYLVEYRKERNHCDIVLNCMDVIKKYEQLGAHPQIIRRAQSMLDLKLASEQLRQQIPISYTKIVVAVFYVQGISNKLRAMAMLGISFFPEKYRRNLLLLIINLRASVIGA